jgi:hypothetical protein
MTGTLLLVNRHVLLSILAAVSMETWGSGVPSRPATLPVRVSGTAIGPSVRIAAVVLCGADERCIEVALPEGYAVSGWRVVAVGHAAVTLEYGNERHVLPVANPKPATAQASAERVGLPSPAPSSPREPVTSLAAESLADTRSDDPGFSAETAGALVPAARVGAGEEADGADEEDTEPSEALRRVRERLGRETGMGRAQAQAELAGAATGAGRSGA